MKSFKRFKRAAGILAWLGLFLLIPALFSWFNQSRFNTRVDSLYQVDSQGENILLAPIVDFNGRAFNLSQLNDQFILLDFWASWCPPCRLSMPELDSMHREMGDKVTVLAINVMEPLEDGKKFAQAHDYALNYVRSPALAHAFNIKALPSKILLDSRGEVKWAVTGHVPYFTHKWLELKIADLQ